eukprot:scaffold12368_cov34-Phaeocystis_antarctica.AAC.2
MVRVRVGVGVRVRVRVRCPRSTLEGAPGRSDWLGASGLEAGATERPGSARACRLQSRRFDLLAGA